MSITEQYPRLAARTAATLSPDAALIDGALGLCGEVGELVAAIDDPALQGEIIKELGDCWWYVAVRWLMPFDIANPQFLHYRYNPLGMDKQQDIAYLVGHAGHLADMVKKAHIKAQLEGGSIMERLDRKRIQYLHLPYICNALHYLATLHGTTTEAVLEANIAKLKARHPDTFNPHYAQPTTNATAANADVASATAANAEAALAAELSAMPRPNLDSWLGSVFHDVTSYTDEDGTVHSSETDKL